VQHNNVYILNELIINGADPNLPDNVGSHLELSLILRSSHVYLTHDHQNGTTPLMYGASIGNLSIVDALLLTSSAEVINRQNEVRVPVSSARSPPSTNINADRQACAHYNPSIICSVPCR